MSQLAPWRAHLEKYRKAHPKLSLKEAMQGASKTFKKGKQKGGSRRPASQPSTSTLMGALQKLKGGAQAPGKYKFELPGGPFPPSLKKPVLL